MAAGQSVIDPARITPAFRDFDPMPNEKSLKCEVMPLKPRIDFGFRFQAGYFVRVPLNQYRGAGHSWSILTRVTPQGEHGEPVMLLNRIRLPNVPVTNLVAEVGGSYLLGEGKYTVDLLLYDDSSRACRKTFQLEAKRGRGERDMTLRLQPGQVRSIASRHAPTDTKVGERPYRISVLVDVAPMFPRSTRLRAWDKEMLLGTLGPMLELLPAQSVRLVMFNLDQQKVIFTQDKFGLEDIGQVAQALNGLELGTINIGVLGNTGGHVSLLSELINQELHATEPPDALVFLGPISRHIEKFPQSAIDVRGGGDDPRMFYVQYRPPVERGAFSDIIENAVRLVKGKTFHVHNPSEFAAAIRQISRF